MNTVRTVSDTKRTFYSIHTRPINSIYRRIVDELMVEAHLLMVNVGFRYNPIYALGFVSAFDRLMAGYQPEADKESIFVALCQALESDMHQYRQDAQSLESYASKVSLQDIVRQLSHPELLADFPSLQQTLQHIQAASSSKYSRLFGLGLVRLLELADPEALKDEKQRSDLLKQICEPLQLSSDKLQKDLDIYQSSLEKIGQARTVLEETLKADRKQRDRRAEEKEAVTKAPEPSKPDPAQEP